MTAEKIFGSRQACAPLLLSSLILPIIRKYRCANTEPAQNRWRAKLSSNGLPPPARARRRPSRTRRHPSAPPARPATANCRSGQPARVPRPSAAVPRPPAAGIAGAFRRFAAANPTPRGELQHINPFTLLVAVVLSAQATDAGVNKATPALFKLADTPETMIKLGEPRLRELIKTIGL